MPAAVSQRPATTANTEQARARLDPALRLAEDAGMHFYDAELLRLRVHTHTDPEGPPSRHHRRPRPPQGATVFELRAALDDFELRGHPALIDAARRIPTNNMWPELAQAQASLSEHSPRT